MKDGEIKPSKIQKSWHKYFKGKNCYRTALILGGLVEFGIFLSLGRMEPAPILGLNFSDALCRIDIFHFLYSKLCIHVTGVESATLIAIHSVALLFLGLSLYGYGLLRKIYCKKVLWKKAFSSFSVMAIMLVLAGVTQQYVVFRKEVIGPSLAFFLFAYSLFLPCLWEKQKHDK